MKTGLVIGILLLSNLCFAQTFRTGIKAGVNLSYLGTRDATNSSSAIAGYHVGWIASWDATGFALQTEVSYSRQGGSISIPSFTYQEIYNYVNISVALKFDIGKDFSFHFGPYFAFLINATQKESGQPDLNIDDFISSTDYGAFAGFGYDLNKSWLFEIRYNYGLTNVRTNVERRNRFFQLSASYFLK